MRVLGKLPPKIEWRVRDDVWREKAILFEKIHVALAAAAVDQIGANDLVADL